MDNNYAPATNLDSNSQATEPGPAAKKIRTVIGLEGAVMAPTMLPPSSSSGIHPVMISSEPDFPPGASEPVDRRTLQQDYGHAHFFHDLDSNEDALLLFHDLVADCITYNRISMEIEECDRELNQIEIKQELLQKKRLMMSVNRSQAQEHILRFAAGLARQALLAKLFPQSLST